MLPHFPPPPPSSAGWPLWLDTCRVEDSALADAYDRTPMPYRAGIKQCLALCQSVYGESPEDLLHATAHSGRIWALRPSNVKRIWRRRRSRRAALCCWRIW